MTMIGLTKNCESLQSAIDGGFRRIEPRFDVLEKGLDERINTTRAILAQKIDFTREVLEQKIDLVANRIDQKIDSRFDSLKTLIEQGFANVTREKKLDDKVASLELDVERLKAAVKL